MMKYYFSQQKNGFYNSDLHGDRMTNIVDPDWIDQNDGTPPQLITVENPACKIPADAVEITEAQYHEYYAAINAQKILSVVGEQVFIVDPPPLTTTEILLNLKTDMVAGVQKHMDDAAKALGYDDIKSAVTYAEEPAVAKFQNEGLAFRQWRSLVWASCYTILESYVFDPEQPLPTLADLIVQLPELELPS
jgi:hypothetical protein